MDHVTTLLNLLVEHETLKPQGLISAGICSYLFLYIRFFYFFLDKAAFAGRIKPDCRSKKGTAASFVQDVLWATQVQWPGNGLSNLAWISCFNSCWFMAPAVPSLTPAFSPAKFKGCLRELGISWQQWCWTPELSKWPRRRLISPVKPSYLLGFKLASKIKCQFVCY